MLRPAQPPAHRTDARRSADRAAHRGRQQPRHAPPLDHRTKHARPRHDPSLGRARTPPGSAARTHSDRRTTPRHGAPGIRLRGLRHRPDELRPRQTQYGRRGRAAVPPSRNPPRPADDPARPPPDKPRASDERVPRPPPPGIQTHCEPTNRRRARHCRDPPPLAPRVPEKPPRAAGRAHAATAVRVPSAIETRATAASARPRPNGCRVQDAAVVLVRETRSGHPTNPHHGRH